MQPVVHSFNDKNAVKSEAVSPKCFAFYFLMPSSLKIASQELA